MSLKELGIEHKSLGDTLVATVRRQFADRKELRAVLEGMAQAIPEGRVTGPAFCVFQFVSSVTEGFEGEAGFPVSQPVETPEIKTRILPAMDVLCLTHKGPADRLNETYVTLYRRAAAQGLISDEFAREVYLDANNPGGNEIEVQFVLHDWVGLLGRHLARVLGEEAGRDIMRGSGALSIKSTLDDRFRWVKGAMERLDCIADESQKYDAVSGCAHVFPRTQIQKLRAAYDKARAETSDPLDAVDAVIEFMAGDPCWGERPRREGRVVYSSKKPRDPKAYEAAAEEAEKRKAYCFCPIVRNRMDQGMPLMFCYCGGGWYRQQWEGAVGKPVRIEIVESVLRGDERCTFAIRLPDDL